MGGRDNTAGAAAEVDSAGHHRQPQFVHDPGLAVAGEGLGGLLQRVEAGRDDGSVVGVREDVEIRKHAVGCPRHLFFFEDFVDPAAQGIGVAIGAGTGIGRADDLECRDPGCGGEGVGIERALMRDLLAV